MIPRFNQNGGMSRDEDGKFVRWSDAIAVITQLEEKIDALRTKESAPPAGTAGKAADRVQLWFFRDLNDEQRLRMFGLFGLPVEEIGPNHGRQSMALKHIIDMAREAVRASAQTDILVKALTDEFDNTAMTPITESQALSRAISALRSATPSPQTRERGSD